LSSFRDGNLALSRPRTTLFHSPETPTGTWWVEEWSAGQSQPSRDSRDKICLASWVQACRGKEDCIEPWWCLGDAGPRASADCARQRERASHNARRGSDDVRMPPAAPGRCACRYRVESASFWFACLLPRPVGAPADTILGSCRIRFSPRRLYSFWFACLLPRLVGPPADTILGSLVLASIS